MRHRFGIGGDKGISPLAGEAVFVFIVLILAGCLAYFIHVDRAVQGGEKYILRTEVEKNREGNWILTVTGGRTDADHSTLLVGKPPRWMELNKKLNLTNGFFVYNDNNDDTFLGAGDTILLYRTAGVIQPGWKVELVDDRGEVLSRPLALPD
jgi:hypothetical protein